MGFPGGVEWLFLILHPEVLRIRLCLASASAPGFTVSLTFPFVADPISKRHITDSRTLAELAKPPRQKPGVRRHFTTTYIRRPLPEVFAFFSDARNLEAITPAELEFHVLN